MEFIKGVTFAPFAKRGALKLEATKKSLKLMQEKTGADLALLIPLGLQENAHSEDIDFNTPYSFSDEELIEFIHYAKSLGLKVALKPTVNCLDGTWRAHINFFDKDVPCEPKWSNWFASYTKFQMYYAKIAQDTGCDLFIAGCEMVQTERRVDEWRTLLRTIKTVYTGPVSYNTDKYQEDNVQFWDEVDVISSSGYYPSGKIEEQLDRIEKVVLEHNKPFIFAEFGCKSVTDASKEPNNYMHKAESNLQEQGDWYEEFMSLCEKRSWLNGFCLWDWPARLNHPRASFSYSIYSKPAQEVVFNHYSKYSD